MKMKNCSSPPTFLVISQQSDLFISTTPCIHISISISLVILFYSFRIVINMIDVDVAIDITTVIVYC